MNHGGLVPDETIFDIIKNRIVKDDCAKGMDLSWTDFQGLLIRQKQFEELIDITKVLLFIGDDEVILKQ